MEGNNKKELAAISQQAMDAMEGQDSGYIESLPEPVKKRVEGLKKLQTEYSQLELQFFKEVHELELKYDALYHPLFDKRSKIVSGDVEVEGNDAATPKGVPEFWYTALINLASSNNSIEEYDEPVLKHLVDIRYSLLPNQPGFKLEFEFAENEFFTNKILTKTYYLQDDEESGDQMFDHSEGCTIDWKPEKNVTMEMQKKTQKKKGTKQKRVVTQLVPRKSFFDFFSPPAVPKEGDVINEDEVDDLEMRMEEDYALGSAIKEKLIPRAVLYFTGEAVQEEEDYDMEGEDFDDEDEDGDDGEDDDDDDEPNTGAGVQPGQNPEQCKQQ